MNKQNVLKNTVYLTLSGIIAKTVDFVFRSYYSRCLGSEGMGLFSLVMSAYGIMLTFASAGLGIAVSKIISEQYAVHNFSGMRRAMRISVSFTVTMSIIVICAVFIWADYIAKYFLKDERCAKCLVFIIPSILFMSVSYCIKGYFYATRRVLRPASSEFLEQFFKIFTISFLLKKWLPFGIEKGCQAVFLGLTIGEFSSCLYLSLLFFADIKQFSSENKNGNVFSAILKVSVPAMTSALVGSFLRMQEDVWIVAGFKKFGMSAVNAMSSYGTVHGMIMPLLVFPLTLLSSFNTLIVPEISRAVGTKNNQRLLSLTSRILKFTSFIGFMVMCIFFTFSKELSATIYNKPEISDFVKYMSFLCPFMFFDMISCGILNGLGFQGRLLIISLTDNLLRLFLIFFGISRIGLPALIFTIFISNFFTFALTLGTVVFSTKLKYIILNLFVKPLLSVFLTYLIVSFISIPFIPCIAVCIILYIAFSFIFGVISLSDINWMHKRLLS